MTKAKTGSTKSSAHSIDPPKKLVRLPRYGKIAGVCAGLADYMEIDASVIRVIFVILTLASGGFGILVYLILALVMPVASKTVSRSLETNDLTANSAELAQELRDSKVVNNFRIYTGAALMLFGIWLLLVNYFPAWISLNWQLVWPSALVLLGIVLISKSKR